MSEKYQNIAVFGLGKTGLSAVKYLLDQNIHVFAYDDCLRDDESKIEGLAQQFDNPKLTISPPENYDWHCLDALVLSAGIPFTHPKPHSIVALANASNCPIICDVEILYKDNPSAKYIAITGTNGKSTTTALTTHIANLLSKNKWAMGGNIGIAALDLPQVNDDGGYIIEMSSYQLDLVHETRFNIAILLNITPDHIDRHGDISGYITAKKQIFNHNPDYCIISVDDESTLQIYKSQKACKSSKSKVISISTNTNSKADIIVSDNVIYDNLLDTQLELSQTPYLCGVHNMQNIAASYAAMKYVGYNPAQICAAISSFKGLEHRMQIVKTIGDIQFINDSKATNAIATKQALSSYDNIYWIVGGVAKEGGIEELHSLFKNVKHTFLIGKSSDEFAQILAQYDVAFTESKVIANAVDSAYKMALENGGYGVIMLSPACASFDQFANFEERGQAFCDAIEGL